MTVSTNVVWIYGEPNQADGATIAAQAAPMASEGKTDDVMTKQENTPVTGQYTVGRTWTTTADAEEWVAFVLTYNPVSAGIVP